MYFQDKHSTTQSEVQSEVTEEATPIHLTKVYKLLSHGTEVPCHIYILPWIKAIGPT